MSALTAHELDGTSFTTSENLVVPPAATKTASPATHSILVVFQRSHSRFYLSTLDVTSLESGKQVMIRLYELWQQEFSPRVFRIKIHSLFWKAVIEEASIQNVSTSHALFPK